MAQVTIGGAAVEVALPNFKALKAAWKYIAAAQADPDPIAGLDAVLGVVSVGAVGQTLSVDELEERLLPSEVAGLRPFIDALLVEIGLAVQPGEATPAGERASPSTATSTTSSAPSSPVSEAPTGTV